MVKMVHSIFITFVKAKASATFAKSCHSALYSLAATAPRKHQILSYLRFRYLFIELFDYYKTDESNIRDQCAL